MTDKHLLMAVCENSSMAGIHFMSSFFKEKRAVKVTLLYIAPASPGDDLGINDAWLSPGEKKQGNTSARMKKTLEESRKLLVTHGFEDHHIDIRVSARMSSTVKDIIREGHGGHYDAVILGRRGVSRFEKFIGEGVSDEMLQQSFDFPLWICRNPEAGRKNVLLCIDGSDTALRVADHVGFMLGSQEEHKITLFHVDRGQKIDIESFFEIAGKLLVEYGVKEEYIRTRVVKALRVGKAILNETEEKKYAVVAAGLLGRQHEGIKEWIMGSKSLALVQKIDKAVFWGCR